jgi:hypothetical protein
MENDTQKRAVQAAARSYDIKNSVVSQRIAMALVLIAGGSSASLSLIQVVTPELWAYLIVALVALAAVVVIVREQPKTTLGSDGIYTKWMNRTHYVPLSEIVDVMHTGEKPPTLQVLTRKAAFRNALVNFQGTATEIARFSADLAELRKSVGAPTDDVGAPKFARGNQRVADWVAGVRATVDTRGAHYRAATIPREQALEYVQDTTLSTDVRAGAAIALAENVAPHEKAVLLRVAAACASPVLRRVFENAADGRIAAGDLESLTEGDAGDETASGTSGRI